MSDSEFLVRDNRQARHFWADNEVVDVFGAQLGAHAFAVYMVLCRHAMNQTGEVRISARKIGKAISISPTGALNALDHLIRLGLAREVVKRDNAKPGLYQLADVKALLDPSYAQMRLAGVHTVDTSKGVNPVDTGVHPVDAVSTRRTRNKEDKTSYKTTKLNPPTPAERGLTPRQLQNLSKELQRIYGANVGTYTQDFEEQAIKTACLRLCLPLDAARKAIAESEGR